MVVFSRNPVHSALFLILVFVNAAGMWARQLAARSGVTVPLQAAEHYYLITEEMAGLDPSWPVIEDPMNFGYYREEVGGLMIGLFEAVCAPWHVDGIPTDSSFTSITRACGGHVASPRSMPSDQRSTAKPWPSASSSSTGASWRSRAPWGPARPSA